MGIFSTPLKRITPYELHHRLIGELKSGDHKLTQHQAEYLKDILEAHSDPHSSAHPEKGVTADEFEGVIKTLRDNRHESHGIRFTDHQVAKIEEHGKKYIEKSVSGF